jgi:murein DD-endopeptidase MepM/ murein hydrolase activator NlpD
MAHPRRVSAVLVVLLAAAAAGYAALIGDDHSLADGYTDVGVTLEQAAAPGSSSAGGVAGSGEAPSSAAAVTATPSSGGCEPSPSPAYCVYTVAEGDTLGHIAERFGLTGGPIPGWDLLVWSNVPDIVTSDDYIQPGQKLRVPTARGVVHTILLDETITDLAYLFDVTTPELIAANPLRDPNLVVLGQNLLIPDPPRLPDLSPPEELVADAPLNAAATPADEPDIQAARAQPARAGFIWPINARVVVTQYMSARHPLGIDLGLSHAPSASIVSVAPGRVAFAGGDACCSYGLYVVVDHGDGLRTLYAHLSRISVSVGQQVSQGQVLGIAGATGRAYGVHLHFEVTRNNVRINPIPLLP